MIKFLRRHASPLAGYQCLRRLGEGSEGETWLARDLSLQRLVTLKRLYNLGVHRDQSSQRRSLIACAGLTHPSIARVYATLTQGADLWIVAEYVEGISLPAPGIFNGPMLTQLMLDLAEALQGVHAAGVVHGDVAPNNIVIDTSGRARLLDFGIARIAGDVGTGAGTPGFVAPEVLMGEPVAVQQDAYSVGALFFWLLSGQLPEYLNDSEGERLQVLPTPRAELAWPAEALWQAATALVAVTPANRPSMPELVTLLRELKRSFPDDARAPLQRWLLGEHPLPGIESNSPRSTSSFTGVDAEQAGFAPVLQAQASVGGAAELSNPPRGVVTEDGAESLPGVVDRARIGAGPAAVAAPEQSASNAPPRKSRLLISGWPAGGIFRLLHRALRFVVPLRGPVIGLSLALPLMMLITGMMLREPPPSTLDLQQSRVDMQPGAKPSAHLTPIWLDKVLHRAATPHWLLDDTSSVEQLAVTVRCRGAWCQLMMAHDQAELEHWHQTTLPVTSAPALWRGALTDLVNIAAAE